MFLMILPPQYTAEVGDEGLERQPNGTGPYRYAGRTPGSSLRLTANKHYWQPDLPHIQDVTFRFVPPEMQVDELMQGRADMLTKLRGSDTLVVMSGPNSRVTKRQEAVALWVSLKNYDSPFADVRIRKAVNYAINREHLIEYVDKGSSASQSTPTSTMETGYNEALHAYPFDLKRARQLLREGGYPNGFTVRALITTETSEMVRAIKSQLRMIGIELELEIVPWQEFLSRLLVDKSKDGKPERTWDMTAWLTSNPTLNAFFIPMVLFYSKSPYAIMHDPVFDQQFNAYLRAEAPELRQNKLNKLQARALTEAYGIFVAQRVQIYGLHWDLSIQNHPTGMLMGRTLAEAYWDDRPGSLWDERPQPEQGPMRGRNETGNQK